MNLALPNLRVDRARLANARPGDRDRLASALEMASPAATGIAGRGLLLVRKVRVDRPLGAGVEGFAGELIDRIRAAKVSARRGSLGAGDSVYFESEIALEVAIVGAWLAGEPLPEMVRRSIPGSATPLLRWRRLILPKGRSLVAALAALVEAGTAGRWLAHFDDGELDAATALVLRTYGGELACVDAVAPPRISPVRGASRVASAAGRPSAMREALAIARGLAPTRAASMLLAVAILAARRPALIATAEWGEALRELRQASPVAESDGASPEASDRSAPASEATDRPASRISAPPRSDRPATGARKAIVARRGLRDAAVAPKPSEATQSVPVPTAAPHPVDAPPPVFPVTAAAVHSAHAGLFFLLNSFLALGLYGDFTDPARELRGLSPFELLLLLGRRWGLARDPIDPLLRSLSGLGPRERVGQGFDAPTWHVPPDWLAPWPDLPARKIGTSLWHPAGFPLADCREDARPTAWMRRRWVACLSRYIEARLARALGVANRAAAVRMLIDRPGTIEVDAEHVEIAFALDLHPLAIRLAGLDRDPGWIPAAGRTIGFRFT